MKDFINILDLLTSFTFIFHPAECDAFSSPSFGTFFFHVENRHAESSLNNCEGCLLTMTSIENVVEHLTQCCKFSKFNCLLCNFGTLDTEVLVDHYVDRHPSFSIIFCERSTQVPNTDTPGADYDPLPMRFTKTVSMSAVANNSIAAARN